MKSFKRYVSEKLKASDDMADWIDDFEKSDAPQFKGKSQKKRQQMAIAAKLSAERNEEVELDEKAAIQYPTYKDYVAARKKQGLQVIPEKLWNNLKKDEEVELDEAEMSLYDKIKAARANPSPDKPVRGRGSKNRNPKTYDVRNTLDKEDDRIQAAVKKKLKKEEVELDEGMSETPHPRTHVMASHAGSSDIHLWKHIDGKATPIKRGLTTAEAGKLKRDHDIKWVRHGAQKYFNDLKNEEVELDEVLDTPKAMDSYKNKAKASKEKAASSAAAKILRGKNADGSRADHSPELKTMAKREKGLKMADKNAMKKTFKKLRGEEVELDEKAPKMQGDWLKKERERNRAHDAAMGRTPTGRKKPVRQMTSTQRSLAKIRGEEASVKRFTNYVKDE